MSTQEKVDAIIQKQGYDNYKWINPAEIIVSQWVRMKCLYGCNEYGKTATCPPNVPSLEESERFFQEYGLAVIIHFEKEVEKPCLLYTSPSPRDRTRSRMPSSA